MTDEAKRRIAESMRAERTRRRGELMDAANRVWSLITEFGLGGVGTAGISLVSGLHRILREVEQIDQSVQTRQIYEREANRLK